MPTSSTILTVQDFENLTSNYYLSSLSNGNYYSSTTLSRLPSIISNVEINLNAMLNGRLYKRYPPSNLQYHGINGLTPQVEQETLLQCLTECVEYKLITQQYVNLNNTYSGAVNGSNNYQTVNNNVIGLRQDITAKLTVLGLYASILLGDKKPDAVLWAEGNNTRYGLTYGDFEQWASVIQNTSWNFTKPCYFNGGINASNPISCNDLNATTVNASTINATNLSLNQGNVSLQGINLSVDYNNNTYSFPTSMLNFATPWEASLEDWSFFATTNVTDDTATATLVNIVGGYYIPNALMVNQTSSTVPLVVIKCHWHSVSGYVGSMLSKNTWFDSSTNEIDVNAMLTALYPNGIGSPFAISSQQLQDAGISLSTFTNIGNAQLVIDKIEAKINQLQGDWDNGSQTTMTIIDPIFQEPCPINIDVSYDSSNNLTGTITFLSPKYQVVNLACNPAFYPQVNIGMDVYFTIVIPV